MAPTPPHILIPSIYNNRKYKSPQSSQADAHTQLLLVILLPNTLFHCLAALIVTGKHTP